MSMLVFQSLWAMEHCDPGGITPPRPEAIRRISDHGFAGVTEHFHEPEHARALAAETEPLGLQIEAQCFPVTVDDLQPTLELGTRYGCHHVTIQADVRTRDLGVAAPLLEGWQRLAEQVDFPVLLETHRNRLTDDLYFTLDLLEQVPDLRLLGDLSHYVAGHEMALTDPETPGVRDSITKLQQIMERCDAYHGRVASNEVVQLPVSFPQNQPWVDVFSELWGWGFRNWKNRAGPDDTLSFTCELGTRPYSITGADGMDITDRWAESLQMKSLAESIWND